MKRVLIIGGSYNPPHDGHEHTFDAGYEHVKPDEVWMWVSRNPFKPVSEYPDQGVRMEMCSVLTEGRPWLKVTDIESNFFDTKTASSLTILSEMFPKTEFIWTFGDDNFATFQNWNDERFILNKKVVPDWQYLMNKFSIAVIHRPGYRESAMNSVAADHGRHLQIEDPADLGVSKNGWAFVNNETVNYSSTDIKKAIAQGERNIDGLHPRNEQIIYDNNLFGLSDNFDGVAHVSVLNNKVRFQTFMLLANTTNLVKSLAHNGSHGVDYSQFVNHFSSNWDRCENKGDFQNYHDVPDELADCLLTLCWIADNETDHMSLKGKETHKSTSDWCDEHYPGRNIEQKLKDYIEELAELCVCEGLEKHRAVNIMNAIFEGDDLENPQVAIKKNFKRLDNYARDMGYDLSTLLDGKMFKNRQRTQKQSAERLANKKAAMVGPR